MYATMLHHVKRSYVNLFGCYQCIILNLSCIALSVIKIVCYTNEICYKSALWFLPAKIIFDSYETWIYCDSSKHSIVIITCTFICCNKPFTNTIKIFDKFCFPMCCSAFVIGSTCSHDLNLLDFTMPQNDPELIKSTDNY